MVAIGEHAAAFERRTRLPLHAELAGQRHVGSARRGLDVAALERVLDIEIVPPLLMDGMAAAAHVARRVDDRIQYFEIDRNGVGEVFRFATRRRDAGGDGVADIAHLVGRERRPRRRFGASRVRDDPDRFYARKIGRGKDPAARLRRNGNRFNPRVRMRTAQERDLHRAGQLDVGDELTAPVEVPVVLLAQ